MPWVCDYCRSSSDDDVLKCNSCGAPAPESVTNPDIRFCPHCQKRLLALGSPACNYCGRKLPDGYVKAMQAGLHRINELERDKKETEKSVSEVLGLLPRKDDPPDESFSDLVGGLIRLID